MTDRGKGSVDREKVIKAMECCQSNQIGGLGCDRCPNLHTEDCEGLLHHFALELLKAQEPVKPTEPDEDNTKYCGVCGSAVGYEVIEPSGLGYVRYNYCPNCGRAVKWDG